MPRTIPGLYNWENHRDRQKERAAEFCRREKARLEAEKKEKEKELQEEKENKEGGE